MPRRKYPPVPSGLATGGRDLWNEIVRIGTLRPDRLRILGDACHEADLIDRLEAALHDAPLTVLGSMKQEVASPLVSELRQHRATLNTLLRSLTLATVNDESGADGAVKGREAAIALSRRRWGAA